MSRDNDSQARRRHPGASVVPNLPNHAEKCEWDDPFPDIRRTPRSKDRKYSNSVQREAFSIFTAGPNFMDMPILECRTAGYLFSDMGKKRRGKEKVFDLGRGGQLFICSRRCAGGATQSVRAGNSAAFLSTALNLFWGFCLSGQKFNSLVVG